MKNTQKKIIIAILFIIILSIVIATIYMYTKNNDNITIDEINITSYLSQTSANTNIGNIDILKNFPNGTKDAINNDYVANINMDYNYKNNIGCKINNLVISDTDISIITDFHFKDTIAPQNLEAGIIIYDESKNLYCNFMSSNIAYQKDTYSKAFYKKTGLSNKNELGVTNGFARFNVNENRVLTTFSTTSKSQTFPSSEKLYITIYDIGYYNNEKNEYVYISKNTAWNFVIDVPKIFKDRTNIEFTLSKNVNNFKLSQLIVSNTGTKLIGEFSENENIFPRISIIDENGTKYNGNFSLLDKYVFSYDLNKNMLTNKMFLQFENSDELIELVQK